MTDPRVDPPLTGTERETLVGFLDWHRGTLEVKCAGVSDADLRRAASPPSTLTLLGLMRHLTEVERVWFRVRLAGEDLGRVYSDTGDFQAAYDVTGADTGEARDNWHREVEAARKITAAAELDATGYDPRHDVRMSLRWILTHMIEEYARHNGHADLIREAIDGSTGE